MSVEDWARREAEQQWLAYDRHESDVRATPAWGIVHAFDALLSDEAVEAAARSNLDGRTPGGVDLIHARDILQAAVRAVTEGDSSE